jgi:hypothetical protein
MIEDESDDKPVDITPDPVPDKPIPDNPIVDNPVLQSDVSEFCAKKQWRNFSTIPRKYLNRYKSSDWEGAEFTEIIPTGTTQLENDDYRECIAIME